MKYKWIFVTSDFERYNAFLNMKLIHFTYSLFVLSAYQEKRLYKSELVMKLRK